MLPVAEQLTDIITYRAAIIAKLLYASLHFSIILMYYQNCVNNDYLNLRLGTQRPTERLTDRPTDRPTDQPTNIATYRAANAAKKVNTIA